jgi:hypothetical protein
MGKRKTPLNDIKEDVLQILPLEFTCIQRIAMSAGHTFYNTKTALEELIIEKKAEKIITARQTQWVSKYRKIPQASKITPLQPILNPVGETSQVPRVELGVAA